MKSTLKLSCAIILIVLFSNFVFSQQTEETAKNYYKLGIKDLETDNYDSAVEFFTIALGVKSDFTEAYLARSKARQYKGDFKDAFSDVQKIIKLDPKFGEAYFRRAKLRGFLLAKQLREMIEVTFDEVAQTNKLILEDFDSSVKTGYKSVEVYTARANHKCELMKMCREAVSDFDFALAIKPGDAELLQRRTIAKYRSGDKQGATADYLKIVNKIDLSPRGLQFAIKTRKDVNDSPALAGEIARASIERFLKKVNEFNREEKTAEAIAELTKGIEIYPDNWYLYDSRANLLQMTRNADLLENDAFKIIELNPFDFETQRRAIHYLMGVGRCQTALNIMEGSIIENPKNPDAYLWRGNSKSCLEDFEGALADNDIAISLDPSNESYKANRANTLSRQNSIEESLDTYTEVINALELKLSVSKDSQEISKTKRDLSFSYIARSRIYAKQDKVAPAFYDLDRAVQVLPEFHNYRIRARAYTWQKKYAEAIRDFNEVIKLQPEDLVFYMERGDVYFLMGNYTEALADYEKASEIKGEIKEIVDQKIQKTKLKVGQK